MVSEPSVFHLFFLVYPCITIGFLHWYFVIFFLFSIEPINTRRPPFYNTLKTLLFFSNYFIFFTWLLYFRSSPKRLARYIGGKNDKIQRQDTRSQTHKRETKKRKKKDKIKETHSYDQTINDRPIGLSTHVMIKGEKTLRTYQKYDNFYFKLEGAKRNFICIYKKKGNRELAESSYTSHGVDCNWTQIRICFSFFNEVLWV